MPLSWNEIKTRAIGFANEWADEASEDAEAKSFWDAFFNVFGVNRRRIASFEVPIKRGDGSDGFIDLLWKGILLVEHKSRGKDLDRAVDAAYGRRHFNTEAERVAFLFERYRHLASLLLTSLLPTEKPRRAKKFTARKNKMQVAKDLSS